MVGFPAGPASGNLMLADSTQPRDGGMLMTPGPVPCWSCGRPVLPGSLTCRSCGVLVDEPRPGSVDSAATATGDASAAADATATIDEREAADGLGSGGIVSPYKVPGAYLSPSAVHPSTDAERGGSVPSSPIAPRGADPSDSSRASMPLAGTPESGIAAQAGPAAGSSTAAMIGGAAASVATGTTPTTGTTVATGTTAAAALDPGTASARLRPGQASLFADLPFDAPSTLVGWLVTLGSGIAAISFLLPWAPGIVDYTSSWGLSSIANLPVLAILVVTVVLAILPSPVPHWIRSAVLPMVGGSLFIGLLWPYVVGDFGAEFGSIAGIAAAVVLVIGGILAAAPRTAKAPPA